MKAIYKDIGIYRITNIQTNESYIGQTKMNFGDRWDNHKALLRHNKHSNPNLQNAWNEYGEDNFEFAVVVTVRDVDRLDDLEVDYIADLKSKNLCYNIGKGGKYATNLGRHLSDETKRKIGEKNRVNMTGKKASEETKKKMSESHSKKIYTEEQRKEMSERSKRINTGRKRSQEFKDKLKKINQDNPPGAKLTPDDIREIRRRSALGDKHKDIAVDYHTSASYISTIVHRRRWAHID